MPWNAYVANAVILIHPPSKCSFLSEGDLCPAVSILMFSQAKLRWYIATYVTSGPCGFRVVGPCSFWGSTGGVTIVAFLAASCTFTASDFIALDLTVAVCTEVDSKLMPFALVVGDTRREVTVLFFPLGLAIITFLSNPKA